MTTPKATYLVTAYAGQMSFRGSLSQARRVAREACRLDAKRRTYTILDWANVHGPAVETYERRGSRAFLVRKDALAEAPARPVWVVGERDGSPRAPGLARREAVRRRTNMLNEGLRAQLVDVVRYGEVEDLLQEVIAIGGETGRHAAVKAATDELQSETIEALDEKIKEKDSDIADLKLEVANKTAWNADLESKHDALQKNNETLQREIEDLREAMANGGPVPPRPPASGLTERDVVLLANKHLTAALREIAQQYWKKGQLTARTAAGKAQVALAKELEAAARRLTTD
jgi:FtsZ-binding cell division protein ZapB